MAGWNLCWMFRSLELSIVRGCTEPAEKESSVKIWKFSDRMGILCYTQAKPQEDIVRKGAWGVVKVMVSSSLLRKERLQAGQWLGQGQGMSFK